MASLTENDFEILLKQYENEDKTRALGTITELRQDDFKHGTYEIKSGGYYKLIENIVFDPETINSNGFYDTPLIDFDASGNATQKAKATKVSANRGFVVGWFASLSIATSEGVTLDLNNKTISHSKFHNLLQRFYSNIELGSAPFDNQGPASFGSVVPARNVVIKNGNFGLSAHHGIHGNNCQNILVQNCIFNQHEVAAISINAGRNVILDNCQSISHKTDVTTRGVFSNAIFLRPYINALANDSTKGAEQWKYGTVDSTILQARNRLKTALNHAYEGAFNFTPGTLTETWNPTNVNAGFWFMLFAMPTAGIKIVNEERLGTFTAATATQDIRVVDGNSYGFLFNRKGVAVNGHPDIDDTPANGIYIKNCTLDNVFGNIMEVPGILNEHGETTLDPIGAIPPVFHEYLEDNDWPGTNTNPATRYGQFVSLQRGTGGSKVSSTNPEPSASYTLSNLVDVIPRVEAASGSTVTDPSDACWNVVLHCQAIVIENKNNAIFTAAKLDTNRIEMNASLSGWLKGTSGYTFDTLIGPIYPNCNSTSKLVLNQDTMAHVNKGVITLKLDGVSNCIVSNCRVSNAVNFGRIGVGYLGVYDKSHKAQSLSGYNGASMKAITISSSHNVKIINSKFSELRSHSSEVVGADIMFMSDKISLQDCTFNVVRSGIHFSVNASKAINEAPRRRKDYSDNPTPFPKSVAVRIAEQVRNVNLKNIYVFKETISEEFMNKKYLILDLRKSINRIT